LLKLVDLVLIVSRLNLINELLAVSDHVGVLLLLKENLHIGILLLGNSVQRGLAECLAQLLSLGADNAVREVLEEPAVGLENVTG